MKTRIQVIFPANRPGRPSWPYVDYDVKGKSEQVPARLRQALPEMEFSAGIVHSTEEAEKLIQQQREPQPDGYLVYMTAMWTKIEQIFARRTHPVVIADDLYAGSGGILSAQSVIQRENLPVLAVDNARTVANVHDDKACRTKLAGEVDARVVMENYHFDIFGWHRVTCYGNYRKACMNLTTLYGLEIYEEDRREECRQ